MMDFDHNMGSMDCVCEDDRPNVTRQRLNGVNFPTLKSLSSRTILANLERIPPAHITEILPPSLRLFLLEKLETLNSKYKKWNFDFYKSCEDEASYRKVFTSFDLLIGLAEPTGFCVDWLLFLSPQKEKALVEVLSVLVEKAPNLQKLVVGGDIQLVHVGDSPWEIPFASYREPLLALKNLTSLTLNKVLTAEDLVSIGNSMPGLEYLECSFICSSKTELREAAIEMISNLKNLRHFTYQYGANGANDHQFDVFCLENFPQLYTFGPDCHLPLYRFGRQIDIPIGCQLRKLSICISAEWFANLDLNPFSMLPNIIELRVFGKLSWSKSELESLPLLLEKLLKFPWLRHLYLSAMTPNPEILRMFLNCYGPNLVSLELDTYILSNGEVLQQLIDHCPKLELLHLCKFFGPLKQPLMPACPGQLPSLKTLYLNFIDSSVEFILLAAPELEKVVFYSSAQLNQAVGQRLSHLVKGQVICTQLISVKLICARSGEMCELAKDMNAFCPQLVDTTFRFSDKLSSGKYPDAVARIKQFKDCCLSKSLNVMDSYQYV